MDVEQEILEIKKRNQKVELDKAWEVSLARKILITILTYAVASVWLIAIHDNVPLLKALVPVVGYLLSTISVPWVKGVWIRNKQN